jgi:hypothetical protein
MLPYDEACVIGMPLELVQPSQVSWHIIVAEWNYLLDHRLATEPTF